MPVAGSSVGGRLVGEFPGFENVSEPGFVSRVPSSVSEIELGTIE